MDVQLLDVSHDNSCNVTLALCCMICQYIVMVWGIHDELFAFCASELCSCCNRISFHEGEPLS